MARNSMRSGAKGGAWRWTDLLRLCVRARRGREESKMGEDRRERKGEREEGRKGQRRKEEKELAPYAFSSIKRLLKGLGSCLL